jgi:N6-L-threonylcarbamoyladenine synthase
MYILGIETSCDDSCVAIYDTNIHKVLANKIISQYCIHEQYQGIVPHLASRSHVNFIDLVLQEALEEAKIHLSEISCIAYSNYPGLTSSLIIGAVFGQTLAYTLGIPFIPVNHIEGHISSIFLDQENKTTYPHVLLSASGGHTDLYLVQSENNYISLGSKLDDAAGECFDKAARIIGLGFGGGAALEKLALLSDDPKKYQLPYVKTKGYSFSFSGLKTAITLKNKIVEEKDKANFAYAIQKGICDHLCQKVILALNQYPYLPLALVGGVSSNQYLTKQLEEICIKRIIQFFRAAPNYRCDNGAMICKAGYISYKYQINLNQSIEVNQYTSFKNN